MADIEYKNNELCVNSINSPTIDKIYNNPDNSLIICDSENQILSQTDIDEFEFGTIENDTLVDSDYIIRTKNFLKTVQGGCVSVYVYPKGGSPYGRFCYSVVQYSKNKKFICKSSFFSIGGWTYPFHDYKLRPETLYVKILISNSYNRYALEEFLEASQVKIIYPKYKKYITYDYRPNFIYNDINKSLGKILEWKKANGIPRFSMLSTTDTHTQRASIDGLFNNRGLSAFKHAKVASEILHPDVFVFTGDFGIDQANDGISDVNQKYNDTVSMFADFSKAWDDLNNDVPSLCALGNHEIALINKRLTPVGTEPAVYTPFTLDMIVDNFQISTKKKYNNLITHSNSYGYYDNADAKIRIFYLNSSDQSGINFSTSQLQWIIERLGEIPEDYGVILTQHFAPIYEEGFNFFLEGTTNTTIEKEIITDFCNHSSGSHGSLSWDFTNLSTQKLICVLCGHQHINMHKKIDGVNWIVRQGYGMSYEPYMYSANKDSEPDEHYVPKFQYFQFNHDSQINLDFMVIHENKAKLFCIGVANELNGDEVDFEFTF